MLRTKWQYFFICIHANNNPWSKLNLFAFFYQFLKHFVANAKARGIAAVNGGFKKAILILKVL